ncbi:cysteine dioxygenase family protein [Pseudothauera rhizosphaerae]|uniref:Cysteine dioxygenase n=1 Tax=Pseudothauera rhizosphaerae TaxID=2565932 RepID=A0A4S4AYK1_9RHOO|nr:cysteine dioxygenase [Pseudothauera rhizosphaerae]THF65236.1 cysteine dioxygenase [Pseudothauera rhizosphaerae]
MSTVAPLREFVVALTDLIESGADEARILKDGRELVGKLVAKDDWLPDAFAQPHPQYYQQYLLYADPRERFSVVSFVWGPGQKTPVHDHTVWGIVGVLRGEEREVTYRKTAAGAYEQSGNGVLGAGGVTAVSPTIGDVHTVENALTDRASISIHVYGGNIGRISRHVFDAATGEAKPFVSGYVSDVVPNLWS